jgi:hypothetical protein
MEGPSLPRFFRVVSPLPPLMRQTFAVLFLAAAAAMVVDVEKTRAVLTPLLALHLFASSSGFGGAARRGYYDLLLTRDGGRLAMALTHWCFSIAPGLTTWLAVAGLEAILRGGLPRQAFAGGSIAAMAIVSMLAWAFTVGLPRFSGAIGWLVTVVLAASMWSMETIAGPGSPVVLRALAILVNPAWLLGRSLDADSAVLLVPALAAGVVAMILACAWIVLADYPLEAAQ